MFALGTVFIGKYKIWITTPIFKTHPWNQLSQDHLYFEVLLSIKEENNIKDVLYRNYFNVDLVSSNDFSFLLSLDDQKRKTDLTDNEEFLAYVDRKNMSMPLWKLSKKNVERLLQKCIELENL